MNIKFFWDIARSRPKLLTSVLLLVVFNIGLYAFATFYQEPRLQKLRQQWMEKRQAAGSGTRDAATIFRQGTTDLGTWHARIAPKKEFTRFIGSLFDMASNNSLKVGSVSYKPLVVKEDKLLAFTISFSVTGKYAAIKSLIADLMRAKDIMTIDNLSLNNTKQTEEAIDMKVQLTAYFRTEGA